MCGLFDENCQHDMGEDYVEFNIAEDVDAGLNFIKNWPTEILFSGREIGNKIVYPVESILKDFKWTEIHPVIEAYKMCRPMPYNSETWDMTVVIQVFYPAEYFKLSEAGLVSIDNIGRTTFKITSEGRHRHLILIPEKISQIQQKYIELCTEPVISKVI